MKQNSLIVFDLDGTLLTDDKQITKETEDILFQLSSQVEGFVIATGRNYSSAKTLLKHLNIPFLWFCNNGAFIYDELRTKKVTQLFLGNQEVDFVLEKIMQCQMHPILHCGKQNSLDTYMYAMDNIHNREYCQQYQMHHEVFPFHWGQSCGFVYTVCIIDTKEKILSVFDGLKREIPDTIILHLLRMKNPDLLMIEFTPEVDKYHSLSFFLKTEWQTEHELIAFGDDNNDRELLIHANLGIAMKNSTIEIKAIANFETEYTNNESGVARFLYKIFNGK